MAVHLLVPDDRSTTRPVAPRRRQLVAWAARAAVGLAVLALATGCDFTPVLDIPLPEHDERVVMHATLVADSTVAVRVSISEDPYRDDFSEASFRERQRRLEGATVELVEDGRVVDTLRQPLCEDFDPIPAGGLSYPDGYRCGPFFSTARTVAGGTYTLRVRIDGLPEATATATVPERVEVSEVTRAGGDRVAFSLRDAGGPGQHYAVQLSPVTVEYENSYTQCDPPDYRTNCRDTTVVERSSFAPNFRTSDPFLLAAARVPGTTSLELVTFDDQTFDGTERAFTLEPLPNDYSWASSHTSDERLWVVSLDAKTYAAYQATWFSLGDDNPFEEPANLPSNVVGGYGLVGAATLHARALPEPPARRARL